MGNFRQSELTIEQMVGISSGTITSEEVAISVYKNYYHGHQNVVHSDRQNLYLTDPTNDTFSNSFFNVCKVVVNVISSRLRIKPDGAGIKPLDDKSADFATYCSDIWVQTDLNSVQNQLHEWVLRDGSAALQIEWVEGVPQFTAHEIYDGATGVKFFMSETDKDEPLFVTRTWKVPLYDDTGEVTDTVLRMNLYLPGEIYRYWSPDASEWTALTPEEVANETMGEEDTNPQIIPLEIIPLILFENNPKISEIADVYKLQMMLNKYGGDIDIMTDLYASPLLTAESGLEPNHEAGPGKGINGVNVRRLDPPDLDKVWNGSVLKWIDVISILKGWPLWILNPRGFTVPSGTALKVAERPLVGQVQEKQMDLDKSWKKVFNMVKMIANDLNPEFTFSMDDKIRFSWVSPATETVIEDREIEVRTAKDAGLPYKTIWEQIYGLDDIQITEIEAEQQESLNYKKLQAEIIQILVSSLIDPANAAQFVNVSEEEVMELVEVLNGSVNTSLPTNSNQGDPSQIIQN